MAPATVRCTISTNLPTPCCSCTTKSPGRSWSGSTWLRRRDGIRRMSLVDVPEPPAEPVRSVSVTTASRAAGARKPAPTAPVVTVIEARLRVGVVGRPAGSGRRARPAPRRCAWPGRGPRWRPAPTSRRPPAGAARRRPRRCRPGRCGGDLERRGRATSSPQLVVAGERGEVEPAHAEVAGLLAQLGQGAERRGAEHRLRGRSARRCRSAALAQPASRNSWLVATRSWARVRTRSGSQATSTAPSGSRSSRVSMPSTRAGASDSMPSTAMPSASFSSRSAAPGSWSARRRGPRADGIGEQQLAARRRPQAVLGDLEAALVGDLEPADLLDRVAPELDPERVLLGGREDVEDAAAHGELAAPLDEVGAGVGRRGQRLDDLLERDVVAGLERDRRQVAQALGRSAAAPRAPARRPPTSGAVACRRRPRGGSAGAAPTAAGRRCRCAG